ncbi:MAG: hypothetical protein JSV43_07695 [Methanobacteriota archaeon]|nr:MAG: hypothetical protein JSV43_07695 [Euryarchaeota archaeon]
MITYLTVTFCTDGARPSEVVNRLVAIGFKPTKGNYDFIYEWDKKAKVEDAIWLADKIFETLKGMDVRFRTDTQ